MKLQTLVDNLIFKYPILFRVRNNSKLSRLKVLNHLFLGFGTGCKWNKVKGILEDPAEELDPFLTLPEGFYSKELYSISVYLEDANDVIEDLGSKYFYSKVEFLNRQKIRIFFEATKKEADLIAEELQPSDNPSFNYPNRAECIYPFIPNDISQFSPLSEVIEGKLHGLMGSETYSFDQYPVNSEWLEAMIEVAQHAKVFYEDPEQCVYHYSHPNKKQHYMFDYQNAEKAGKLDEFRSSWGFQPDETFDEILVRHWEAKKAEQLNYLDKFLLKFS